MHQRRVEICGQLSTLIDDGGRLVQVIEGRRFAPRYVVLAADLKVQRPEAIRA